MSATIEQTEVTTATATGQNRRRVLVTGAAGRIGTYFAQHAPDTYDLRLMVHRSNPAEAVDAIRPYGEIVEGELGDLEGLKRHCAGIDTVLHLAANPDPNATWGSLLTPNVVGVYNIFAAAKSAGCRRVIFASSIHAVSGYPADVQVKPTEMPNPGDLYGVTKAFGECLARYMAGHEGLSAIAIRIGAFMPVENAQQDWSAPMMDAFVSDRDLFQLLTRCIDDTKIGFALFHGLSDNRHKRMDITNARELVGYDPQDDLAKENPHLKPSGLGERVYNHSMKDGYQSGLREDLG